MPSSRFKIVYWLVLTLFLSCQSPLPSGICTKADCTERIGIISAYDKEAQLLIASLSGASQRTIINGTTFDIGVLEGKNVVIVMTGISKVNAAMIAQLLLDRFEISKVVFSGIAGGIDPAHHVGDVIVPDSWAFHDEFFWSRPVLDYTHFTLPVICPLLLPGDFSCLGLKMSSYTSDDKPPFGIDFLNPAGVSLGGLYGRETFVRTDANYPDGEFRFDYPVDADLLGKASLVTTELLRCGENTCTQPAKQECLHNQPTITVGGRGLSGSIFVDNSLYRDYLFNTLHGAVVDMETASVAHVAYANQKPFIAFRSVSDLAGGDQLQEVGTFFCTHIAQTNAASVVKQFIKSL
jgi:adenosylhomocysteine nucleosidase